MNREQELEELCQIVALLELPKIVQQLIKDYMGKNFEKVREMALDAYDGEVPNFHLCSRKPFTRLVVVCYKLIQVRMKFHAIRIPDNIFIDTISDITLRQQLYLKNTGKIGLDKDSVVWFRHIFNIHIFKLNTLQFQLFHMLYLDEEIVGEPYMTFSEEQKKQLPAGTPVINIHIQHGANINPAEVEKSFDMAKNFFTKFFPQHQYEAFICYSWLLYPGNKKLLSEMSNINRFADHFYIIGQAQDNEDAIKRIYGRRFKKKMDYPQDTVLQKNAIKHFKWLGEACGVIIKQ